MAHVRLGERGLFRAGAIIGGAPEIAISALRGYGDDLGLAFQIMDDVLDLTGGSDQLGKPAGHDLLRNFLNRRKQEAA